MNINTPITKIHMKVYLTELIAIYFKVFVFSCMVVGVGLSLVWSSWLCSNRDFASYPQFEANHE